MNDLAESFGVSYDQHYPLQNLTQGVYQGVYPGESMTVLFTPLSGLLRQNKMIPLRYCPITIELELVDNLIEPIFTGRTDGGGG